MVKVGVVGVLELAGRGVAVGGRNSKTSRAPENAPGTETSAGMALLKLGLALVKLKGLPKLVPTW